MSRLQKELPSSFSFTTAIPIRITDINYGGHAGNDSILSLIHEARMQFLSKAGYTELKFEETGLIMRDVQIEFKKELFYGEIITAYLTAANFTNTSFDIYYKFEIKDKGIAVLARTGMVCYDYAQKKIAPVPAGAEKKLNPDKF